MFPNIAVINPNPINNANTPPINTTADKTTQK